MDNFDCFLKKKPLMESQSLLDIGIAAAEAADLTDDDVSDEDILRTVFNTAREIFIKCEASSDFGIQHIGSTAVVFGGTNRLIYGANGWSIDEGLCTPRFVHHWKQIKGQYGKVRDSHVLRQEGVGHSAGR